MRAWRSLPSCSTTAAKQDGPLEPTDPAAALDGAVRDLTALTARGPEAFKESVPCLQGLWRAATAADAAARDRTLTQLGELIATRDPRTAAKLSLFSGGLVEGGANPTLALGAILRRLPDVLISAKGFVDACAAAEKEAAPEGKKRDPIAQHGKAVGERLPQESAAWDALEELCLGAIAMLSRAPQARKQVRTDADLLAKAAAIRWQHGRVDFLWKMLQVLDDEELIVLEPKLKLGYRVKIVGIADNFQLHTLLAGTVVGKAEDGWIPGIVGTDNEKEEPGRPLNPAVVAIARDQPWGKKAPGVWSRLNLWTWQGLQPDGTLSDPALKGVQKDWVWNEGIPADIPPFEGVRVVLIGPSSYVRTWNGIRMFPGMAGDLRVLEKLDAAQVASWLQRIAAAPR